METQSFMESIQKTKEEKLNVKNKFLQHLKDKILKETENGQFECSFYYDSLYNEAQNITKDYNLSMQKYNEILYYAMDLLDKDRFKISIDFQHDFTGINGLRFDVSW